MNNDVEYVNSLKRRNYISNIYLLLKMWIYQIHNIWENACQNFGCLLKVCMSNRSFWENARFKILIVFLKVYMSNISFLKNVVKLHKIFKKPICEIDQS